MRIYCPKCGWQPSRESRWACTCGCVWNTFHTRARCPDCGKQWYDTCCLDCHRWSPHDDWYHGGDGADKQREKKRPVKEPATAN